MNNSEFDIDKITEEYREDIERDTYKRIGIGIVAGLILALAFPMLYSYFALNGASYMPVTIEMAKQMGSPLSAAFLQSLLIIITSVVFIGGTAVKHQDQWGILKQYAVYFCMTYIMAIITGVTCFWMSSSLNSFLQYGVIHFILCVLLGLYQYVEVTKDLVAINGELADAKNYRLLGDSAGYYAETFERLKHLKVKLSWNWGAFWFGPLWLIYRKMYFAGIVMIAFETAISIISFNNYSAMNFDVGRSLCSFGISIIYGACGNYIYMKHIDRIKAKGESMSESERSLYYQRKAGAKCGVVFWIAIFTLIVLQIYILVNANSAVAK